MGGIFGSLMATCVAYEEDGLAEYIPTEENLFEDSIAEEDVATDAGEEESEEEGIGFMKLALGGDQTTDDPEEDIAVVYDGSIEWEAFIIKLFVIYTKNLQFES